MAAETRKRAAKFRVGQVVSVRSFYGGFSPGETGPGFEGKRGWRHGWAFGKIVKVMPPHIPPEKKTSPYCYFLDGWPSAMTEDDLRPLEKSEIAARKEPL